MIELIATYKTSLITGAGAIILALLTGKTFRRLVLLPFKLLASKTRTEEDDLLVEEAARDLGLPENAAQKKKEGDKQC